MTKEEKKALKAQRKKLKSINKKKRKGQSVQDLLGIKAFTKHGLKVGKNTFVFFSVVPTNISVLSYENIEIDTNKSYLLKRIDKEPHKGVRELLKKDFEFLDNLNVEGSTARQFLFIVRCKNASDDQVLTIANRVEKIVSEQNFDIKRLKKDDIKRFLAIYYDASLNGENIPDYDGIQYLKDGKDD